MHENYFILLLLPLLISKSSALWCYHCVSTQPGCGESLNWWLQWTKVCPEDDDVCVKIIEKKGATEVYTRECLSSLTFRSDIPADHYEGCRPAAKDVKLGNYVNTSIKEIDINRNYYDSTTWCFCFLDNWCNSAITSSPSSYILLVSGIVYLLQRNF